MGVLYLLLSTGNSILGYFLASNTAACRVNPLIGNVSVISFTPY
jgi:hypothetical protein